MAVSKLMASGALSQNPIIHQVAAISLGKVHGELLLDLDFVEDSSADVDANLVATPQGEIIEWQTTSERNLLPVPQLQEMVELGMKGIREHAELQQQALRGL